MTSPGGSARDPSGESHLAQVEELYEEVQNAPESEYRSGYLHALELVIEILEEDE